MATVKQHVNKLVISTSDGKVLGKIKDLYLDPTMARVAAVYLGGRGLLRRRKLMIRKDDVSMCGVDAWLVASSDVVVSPGQVVESRDFVPARELHGRQILSEGGTQIATVDDVILDGDCNVKGFTVVKVPASGPVAQRKAIALEAITSLGSRTSPMTTILAQAESTEIGIRRDTGDTSTPEAIAR